MGDLVRFPSRTPQRLVSSKELQAHLGMSERWLRYRVAEGMPVRRWGAKMLRFDLPEVERWLKDRYEEAG